MTSDESGTFAILGVDDGVATQPAVWPWGFTHFGERAQALGRPRVINRGRIEIHDDVVIDSRISPAEFITAPGGRIVVGRGTVIEHGALLLARRRVELGDRVTIGENSIVSDSSILSDSELDDAAVGAPCMNVTSIRIGDDVAIGARVTVLPGTIIGAGARILPGSMVSGEIPSGVVMGGTPARAIRPDGAR